MKSGLTQMIPFLLIQKATVLEPVFTSSIFQNLSPPPHYVAYKHVPPTLKGGESRG